jgi:thiol-disulfide isomerase/thioredoxin
MASPRRHCGFAFGWLLVACGAISGAFPLVASAAEAVVASAAIPAPPRPDTPEDWIGYPLPVLSGKALQGANLRTSEYAGEVVLLAFWASWCSRCELQLLQLQELHTTYRGAGLAVVGVNLDDSPAEASEFAAAAGVGFPVMHDITKRISRRFALLDLPTLVLVDRGGTVRQVYGRLDRKGRKALVEDIRQLLDE